MDGSGEALRPLRVSNDDDQPSAGGRTVQFGMCDRSERRRIAPVTTLGLDEHFHRHARDVAQRLGKESRFPVGRRGEKHRPPVNRYLERTEERQTRGGGCCPPPPLRKKRERKPVHSTQLPNTSDTLFLY